MKNRLHKKMLVCYKSRFACNSFKNKYKRLGFVFSFLCFFFNKLNETENLTIFTHLLNISYNLLASN